MKDKAHKKTTLHPFGFTAGFLLAAAGAINTLIEGPKSTTNAFNLLALIAITRGVYDLYKERRAWKAFRPLTDRVASIWQQRREMTAPPQESDHPIPALR